MPEKFRSAAEMPEPSKTSSAIGSGNEADRRLIRALTDCEPLDWTRRPNGDLVYLNERGQKFILADAEIQKLTDAALEKRKPAASPTKKAGLAQDKKSDPSPIKNTKAEDTSSLVYPEGSE